MKRYIVRPRAGTHPPAAAAAAAVAATQSIVETLADAGAEIVKADSTTGHHVVNLAEADAGQLAASRPDLIVEEDHPIDLFRVPGLPESIPQGDQVELQVTVRTPDGGAIPDCTIFALGPQVGFQADTDAAGVARVMVPPGIVERLVCSPRANFWSRVVAPPPEGAGLDVQLDPLDAAAAVRWWHSLLGIGTPGMPTGQGVSVCVIDSGIQPLPQLNVVDGVNTLDGENPAAWNVDQKGHGTHVAGVIAGRSTGPDTFFGIAPDVTLYSAKVFPGGFVSDIVEALDWCRTRRVDLVNMSLGSRRPSAALADAVNQAVEAGVTIVVAAGNDASSVAWPGALPDSITVGAIGKLGSFPSDSGQTLKIGPYRDWWGGLFSASFTNHGPEIHVCAPGVAIASTVPQGFVAWDGTSMACPMITGLLALALEQAPWLRTGTRYTRDMMAALVAAAAAPTGMPREYAGAGLLTAPRMLRILAG